MVSKPFSKNSKILVFGEVLIDEIMDVNGHKHSLFGGSAANVAVNLAQLGIDVSFVGAKGDDDYGRLIQTTFETAGCDISQLKTSSHPTTVVRMNQSITTPVPLFIRGADSDIQPSEGLKEILKDIEIFHFTYWPLSKNPAKNTLLHLIQAAKSHHILLGFDPNIHGNLLTESSMTLEEREQILSSIYFLKASMDDLERLYGVSYSKEEIRQILEPYQIPWVIITLGKDGVMVIHENKVYHFEALAKNIIDATGAGDAFMSGFYTSFLHGNPIEKMIKDAQTMSALVLNQLGAIAKIPKYKNLHKGA